MHPDFRAIKKLKKGMTILKLILLRILGKLVAQKKKKKNHWPQNKQE